MLVYGRLRQVTAGYGGMRWRQTMIDTHKGDISIVNSQSRATSNIPPTYVLPDPRRRGRDLCFYETTFNADAREPYTFVQNIYSEYYSYPSGIFMKQVPHLLVRGFCFATLYDQ